MTRALSLHHINAMELDPLAFVSASAAAGIAQISAFTHIPKFATGETPDFPLITPSIEREMRARLAGEGVELASVEYFPVNEQADFEAYRPALALGRRLGATRAVIHIQDPDPVRAVDRLGLLCEIAAAEDISLGLEFVGLGPGCESIQKAAWFVDQVGGSRVAIAVDALHLVRTGGSAADVAALAPRYFSYAQICDGHGLQELSAYFPEVLERELPGCGDFPLIEIISALPAATPLEIEIPSAKRVGAGMAAGDYLAAIAADTRSFLERVQPIR